MDPNNPDNTESLGLEPEVNPLMAQQSERTDLADDERLSQFFGRALADGQQESEPQTDETEEAADEDVSDASEIEAENTEAEDSTEQYDEERPQPRGVDKRISKLTALRKEAEERAQKLEEELEHLKRSKATPTANSNNPFSGFDDEEKIQAEYERQKEIRLFCERYPDGYYEDGQEPVDKESIAKAKVNAIRAMEDHLPKQLDYVEKSKAFKAAARREFPWLKDKTDPRTIMASRFVDSVPEIRKYPDYEIYAAHLASGMASYQSQKQSAKQGVNVRVPVQPTSSYAPAASAKKPDAVKAKLAESRYRQSSSLDDLSDVFRNKFI
jgi:hypothetical protein